MGSLQAPETAATVTLKEGDRLGRYTINRLIGRGGWGEVYEAVDPELDRRIALKLLTSKLALDPEMQERFAREARTVAALDHRNIVTIHSVEEVDSHRFITMQLVEGDTLGKLIPKRGMALPDLFRVAIPLADAIAAAHAKGVTHRDIKPANVMVAENGQVKVLDFGLAKLMPEDTGETLVSGPTPAGSVMGTINYMSPEQLRGEEADHRSDIYSLGVVLYEMATGAVPFQGKSSLDVAASILRDRPTGVTEVRRSLPRHLDRIIRNCLDEDPDRRYQSVVEVRNELSRLRQELLSGKRPEAPNRVGRGRWRLILAAAAVALLAVAGSFLAGRNGSGTAAPPGAAPSPKNARIVVLPFEDLGQPAVDYFAPALTEEISSRLAAVDGLGVISRFSANQYAGTAKTARQIGDELRVGYILRGSVQWAADGNGAGRVRILPNLIRVADDTQIWSDPYVGSVDDIFEVQSEIATRVAEQLGRRLVRGAGQLAADRPTESLEAYQAYLRGLHYARRPVYTLDNWALAVSGFADAVAEDPQFALAWAWLARAHAFIVHQGLDLSAERRRLARESIDRATELAPDEGEIRLALGYYYYWVENDYERAQEELALRRQPAARSLRGARGQGLCSAPPGSLGRGGGESRTGLRAEPAGRRPRRRDRRHPHLAARLCQRPGAGATSRSPWTPPRSGPTTPRRRPCACGTAIWPPRARRSRRCRPPTTRSGSGPGSGRRSTRASRSRRSPGWPPRRDPGCSPGRAPRSRSPCCGPRPSS